MIPEQIIRSVRTVQFKLFLSLILLGIVIIVFFLGFHFFHKDYERQNLESDLTTQAKIIYTKKMHPYTWCRGLSYSPNYKYTLLDKDGKIICDSHLILTHPPEFFRLKKIPEIDELVFSSEIIRDPIDKKKYHHGVLKFYYQNKIYYLKKSFPHKLPDRINELRNYFLILLLVLFIVLVSVWGVDCVRTDMIFHEKIIYLLRGLTIPNVLRSKAISESENLFEDFHLVEMHLKNSVHTLKAKSEEFAREKMKLNALIDALSVGVLATDSDNNVLFFNPTLSSWIHFKKQDHLKVWNILRDPDILKGFDFVLKNLEIKHIDNFTVLDGQGAKLYFRITISPFKLTEEGQYGAIAVFQDQTVYQNWKQARVDFVANVSHEVKTPLTALTGYVEILREELSVNPYIDKIESSIKRLINLFDDLLKLSLIESNIKLNINRFDPQELTRNMFNTIKNKFAVVDLDLKLTSEVEFVELDYGLIEQLVGNLIENIFKYAADSKIIQIKWAIQNDSLLLTVQDFGQGIEVYPPERIFERFFRVDQSRNSHIPGTGLGLSIVKNIVLRHGGKISLHTKLGEGTIFNIELPIL